MNAEQKKEVDKSCKNCGCVDCINNGDNTGTVDCDRDINWKPISCLDCKYCINGVCENADDCNSDKNGFKSKQVRTCSTCKDKDCAGSKFINPNCWKPEKDKNFKEQIDHELYENVCWLRSNISGSSGQITERNLISIAKGIIQAKECLRKINTESQHLISALYKFIDEYKPEYGDLREYINKRLEEK